MSDNLLTKKMEDFISDFYSKSTEDQQKFLREGHDRAKHVLEDSYKSDRDFMIIGEEIFDEIQKITFNSTSEYIQEKNEIIEIKMEFVSCNESILYDCNIPWAA